MRLNFLIVATSLSLVACDEHIEPGESKYYPNEVLEQNINIYMKNGILLHFDVTYDSIDNILLSGLDKHFVSRNGIEVGITKDVTLDAPYGNGYTYGQYKTNNHYDFNGDFTWLNQDLVSINYSRQSGSVLESSVVLNEAPLIIYPTETDLVEFDDDYVLTAHWQETDASQVITLSGNCLTLQDTIPTLSYELDGWSYWGHSDAGINHHLGTLGLDLSNTWVFEVKPNQTSISFQFYNEETMLPRRDGANVVNVTRSPGGCEFEFNLIERLRGSVDSRFSGGIINLFQATSSTFFTPNI